MIASHGAINDRTMGIGGSVVKAQEVIKHDQVS